MSESMRHTWQYTGRLSFSHRIILSKSIDPCYVRQYEYDYG